MHEKIELFDTTLRDGTQGEGVNLSLQDKLRITAELDDFGINIIEGGWPGSNPKDEAYFKEVKYLQLNNASICAFGSTARYPDKIGTDNNLLMLLKAETPVISIFGKTWRFHSEKSLGLTDSQNEELIYNSVRFLHERGRRVIFDAEHFFDGFRDDPQFAVAMLKAAQQGGADTLVLCDTNGGTLTAEISRITAMIPKQIKTVLGIHVHDDGGLGTANTLAAVQNGAIHIQGTINGLGERCGNANLCTVIPNLILKMNKQMKSTVKLENLTRLSNFVYEIANLTPNDRCAFVGKSAFTHKGGIHVSSVLKDTRMYEHIMPDNVGNKRNVKISDLSGQSNIRFKARELGLEIASKDFSRQFVQQIKKLEHNGYQFDGAEASFELLLRSELDNYQPFFTITYAKVNVWVNDEGVDYAEAVLKVKVNDKTEHTACDGSGPVSALDNALRKAITPFFPEIASIQLIDYKVRVLGERNGTAAKVRVLVESGDGDARWSTVGVSHNIINASLQAISDSLNYKIYHTEKIGEAMDFEYLV